MLLRDLPCTDELGTVTCKEFPSGKVLHNDCNATARAQEKRGIVLVEDFRSGGSTDRNVIATTKNNYKEGWREERYKTVLGKAPWVTFYVHGLTCAGQVYHNTLTINLATCSLLGWCWLVQWFIG